MINPIIMPKSTFSVNAGKSPGKHLMASMMTCLYDIKRDAKRFNPNKKRDKKALYREQNSG
jgi:hypothetical protein